MADKRNGGRLQLNATHPNYTVSQKKHVTLILFEAHNLNINCPIIIIFGTVVTESISY